MKKNIETYTRHSLVDENSHLNDMLQSGKDGNVDCVIVKSRSRLSDNPQECDAIVKKIQENDTAFYETDPDENVGKI